MQLSVAKYNSFEKRDVGRRLWWVKEIVQWRGDLLTLAFTLFQPGIGKCSKHQGSVGQRPHAKDGPAKKKKKKERQMVPESLMASLNPRWSTSGLFVL